MADKLTRSQIAAINIPIGVLVVAAGAGTGKTTVLSHTVTDKIVAYQLVPDKRISIDELLVLTFTRKTAAEMSERIASRLKELAEKTSDENERKWLLTNAGMVPDAAIETIDAFAVRMLRDHSLESGLDPDFGVLSEEKNLEIGHSVARELLELWLDKPPHELWPEVIKGIEIQDWPKVFHRLDQHLMTRQAVNMPSLLMGRTADAETDIEEFIARMHEEAEQKLRNCVNNLLSKFDNFKGLLIETIEEGSGAYPAKAQKVLDDLPSVIEWLQQPELDWSDPILERVELWEPFRAKKDTPKQADDLTKKVKAHLTLIFQKSQGLDKSDLLKNIALDVRLTKYRPGLASALIAFHKEALIARREQHSLSFADCEIEALNLLNKFPEICAKYNKDYKYVIVDEYQDINPLQQELIFKLARKGEAAGLPKNLYIVGDERQSIYGFRDADFTLLRDLRTDLKNVKEKNAGTRILHENFRSRPEILNFANYIFRELWGAGDNESGIEHTDLKPSLDYYLTEKPSQEPRIELHIVKGDSANAGRRREAAVIADRIRDIVDNREISVTDKSGITRPIEWGDCAVLMRKTKVFNLYENAFSSLGIPVITESGGGFWDSSEVADITSLLYCFSKSSNNLDWAVVLRSPLVGITDNGLYEISTAADRDNWFDVFQGVKLSDEVNREKLDIFFKWFEPVKKMAGRVPVHLLIDKAMQMSGCLDRVMALNRGRVIRANIEKLISVLRGEENLCDPMSAANYISWLRNQETRESQASVSPTGSKGAVTLATVHAAKGREWPLVVLADLNTGKKSTTDEILWNENDGISFKWLDPSTGNSEKTSSYLKAFDDRKAVDISEDQRVMYVALTRAREHLILSSYVRRNKKNDEFQNSYWGFSEPKKSEDPEGRLNKSWLSAIDYVFTRTEESFIGKPDDESVTKLLLKVSEPRDPDSGEDNIPLEIELPVLRKIHSKSPELITVKDKLDTKDTPLDYLSKLESLTELPEPDSRRYLLTATELATFDKCPRMYAYRSVWNVPAMPRSDKVMETPQKQPSRDPDDEEVHSDETEPSENFELPSSDWGNLAHKLLEEIEFDASEDQIREKARNLLELNNLEPDKFVDRLSEMIIKTLRLEVFQSLKNARIHREFKLLGKIDGSDEIVLGIMDLFAEFDDRVLIIDYKSGAVDPDKTADRAGRYSHQLATYAHLASAYKNIPLDKIETRIIFLQPAKPEIVKLSKDILEKPINVLNQLTEFSNVGKFKSAPDEKTCSWCDYKDICTDSVSPG